MQLQAHNFELYVERPNGFSKYVELGKFGISVIDEIGTNSKLLTFQKWSILSKVMTIFVR